MAGVKHFLYRNLRVANANTFFFCKENISIVLVFAACGGAATATIKMQGMGVFRFTPIVIDAAIGGGVTLLAVIAIFWLWNYIFAAFETWNEQKKK